MSNLVFKRRLMLIRVFISLETLESLKGPQRYDNFIRRL